MLDTKSATGVTKTPGQVFGGWVRLLLLNPEVSILFLTVYFCVANRLMIEIYAGTHHTLHVFLVSFPNYLLLSTFGREALADIDVLASSLCHNLED